MTIFQTILIVFLALSAKAQVNLMPPASLPITAANDFTEFTPDLGSENLPFISVAWDASPTPNVAYQVWSALDLENAFTFFSTTTNLFVLVAATNPAQFFAVRAVNQWGIASAFAK